MPVIATFVPSYKFFRERTLGLLDKIEKEPDPMAVLGWRPGPGRAHIAWQLMHIGITEELFASERLAPHKAGAFTDLWPRFRGGSTPDDDIPTAATIRQILAETREHLLATLSEFGDDRLEEVPVALAQKKWTVLNVAHILGWHDAHHQGQAHITFNLFKARQA